MFKLNLIFAASNAYFANYWLAGLCVVSAVVWMLLGDDSDE